MSTGCPSVLQKNLLNLVAGTTAFAAQASKALSTYKILKDRAWNNAPEEYRLQAEVFEHSYYRRHLDQNKNMWIDRNVAESGLTRKDLAQYSQFRYDFLKIAHPLAIGAFIGGWSLLAAPFWLANDTWVPSTYSTTPEQLKEWRRSQDLYRYRYAPAMLTDFRFWYELHVRVPDNKSAAWEEFFEKNDVRRNPEQCSKVSEVYSTHAPFKHIRRKQARHIGRAMGVPTFPTFGKIFLQTRIRDYWELILTEDALLMKENGLEGLTDEELFDYTWRRFLSPVDKELDREALLQRARDYHTFLGGDLFLETGKAPNLFVVISYCMGYYNDPAYLTNDISELEANDYDHLKGWGKDAFRRRLEFENGPLRDQVEAHSQKKLAEYQKTLAEAQKLE